MEERDKDQLVELRHRVGLEVHLKHFQEAEHDYSRFFLYKEGK